MGRRRRRRNMEAVAAGVAVSLTVSLAVLTYVERTETTPVNQVGPLPSAVAENTPKPKAKGNTPVSPTLSPSAAPTTEKPLALQPKRAAPVVRKKPPVKGPSGNCLKGVGTWDLAQGHKAMQASGSCWFYTWSPNNWFGEVRGVQFVPMIWGVKDMDKIGEAKGNTLLGFNEPDLAGQANMSVEQALDLWPKLQATGMRLGSPSPAWGGDVPGGWLDRFMKGADQRGYRVDFITVHFYTANFDTAGAVAELREYLRKVYARFKKPIWLTEFALINHDGMIYPPENQTAAFVRASTDLLESLPYVERYAWFAMPNTRGNGTGLFRDDASPTEPGKAFQEAPRSR